MQQTLHNEPTASSPTFEPHVLQKTSGSSPLVDDTPAVTQTTITKTTYALVNGESSITADALANGFATLIGALLGALLAYWFQTKVLRKQEQRSSHLSAHRTMFYLLQQVNTILLIQRDYVVTELESPARFISIPPSPPIDPNKNVLNANDLSFLLDTAKGRAVLYELYIAQENYVEAIHTWNLRSDIHIQKIQPALATAGLHPGVPVTLESLKEALGPLLYGTIVNATDNSLMTLRSAFEKLTVWKDKVRAYAILRFKSTDFTDFDFPDTWGITTKNPQ